MGRASRRRARHGRSAVVSALSAGQRRARGGRARLGHGGKSLSFRRAPARRSVRPEALHLALADLLGRVSDIDDVVVRDERLDLPRCGQLGAGQRARVDLLGGEADPVAPLKEDVLDQLRRPDDRLAGGLCAGRGRDGDLLREGGARAGSSAKDARVARLAAGGPRGEEVAPGPC